MNKDELIDKIKNILYWSEELLCPKCGFETLKDGNYGRDGCWYGKSESDAFFYCSNEDCKFKQYVYTYSDGMNDDLYLEEIKKVMKNFINE